MKRIGMIGLGLMGHRVAENLMKNGFEMVLYDLRPEAFADLVEAGATGVDSPEEMGRQVDTVLLMVNAFAHCKSAVEPLLRTLKNGVIINLSTISMDEAATLEDMVRAAGSATIDSPVSGGTAGAAAGKLTAMVACEDALLERCRPIFDAFCAKVAHVGKKPGQGQGVKSINQMLVSIHMCAACEAFNLARKCGLDLNEVYDVVCSSAGMSRIFENRGKFFIERNFDSRSTLHTQLKDSGIVVQTAEKVGAPVPLTSAVRDMFRLTMNHVPSTEDPIAVIKLYETMCND